MSEQRQGEGSKGRNIIVDRKAKVKATLGSAAKSKKPSLTGKDEAKLKKLLCARDVNIIVDSSWTVCRSFLASIVISNTFENFMGTIILAQFCFAIVEVDNSAQNEDIPVWLQYLMLTFLTIYILELCVRFYVLRCQFFRSWTNLLDLGVVAADSCVQAAELLAGSMPSVAVFRIFRLARLLRAFRVLTTFRELYIMVHSFIGAMKAIVWATLMIFVVLTLWSILAVEFLHPLNQELSDAGMHKDCERCRHAYETVMRASLTFFQQIIVGDNWGEITIAMIEKYPCTLLIYIPAYVTIGMGLVNLILTVIVDRADSAKKTNEEEKLALKLMAVRIIFSQMDADSSGDVTLDEFVDGLTKQPEMKHALELLGIRVEDLSTVFLMMDYDGSGSVSCDEFVENLLRMKSEETFMILLYVKHFMNVMETSIDNHVDSLREEIYQTRRHIGDVGWSTDASANDSNPSRGSNELQPAVTPWLGFAALKQDVQVMCRSTEAKLEEIAGVVTKRFGEHVDAERRTSRVWTPKNFDAHAGEPKRSPATVIPVLPVRQVPKLATVPDRSTSRTNAPSTARSTSRTNPWEIICGDIEMGQSNPYREIFKPNGEHAHTLPDAFTHGHDPAYEPESKRDPSNVQD